MCLLQFSQIALDSLVGFLVHLLGTGGMFESQCFEWILQLGVDALVNLGSTASMFLEKFVVDNLLHLVGTGKVQVVEVVEPRLETFESSIQLIVNLLLHLRGALSMFQSLLLLLEQILIASRFSHGTLDP